uniref:Uncharacterized protein n=1 Tax=Sphaerodactylus townsendi TaxID=933632 RepID=A0ACB8FIG5_9SAUR
MKEKNCTVQDDDMYNTHLETVIVGRPVVIDCYWDKKLHLNQKSYNLSWYRNGNEEPITKITDSRIHQDDNKLWFLSAKFQDSGLYTCVVWESARCYKSIVRVEVSSNTDVQCFHDELYNKAELPIGSNGVIVCPALDSLKDYRNALSIRWYKECKQLDGERFAFHSNDFIINNINSNDSGMYQCKATYIYEGNIYNISRSILVTAVASPKRKRTTILYPRNNTIEAELGSNVFVECNVSTFRDSVISIAWKVNNTLVDDLFKGRIQEGIEKDNNLTEEWLSVVPLNITELKQEDYGERFVCHAGEVAAYISVQPPSAAIHYTGYMAGGLAAVVLITAVLVLIYMLFKIDIILWYRKSCHPFLNKKALVTIIDETIKQSRRLIIILKSESPSYQLLEEAPEQQIALYNALVHDGIKVILIEMDKIKDYSNMPESIQYIKRKHGAIRWKGDFMKSQSYSASTKFWKKVRHSFKRQCSCTMGYTVHTLLDWGRYITVGSGMSLIHRVPVYK